MQGLGADMKPCILSKITPFCGYYIIHSVDLGWTSLFNLFFFFFNNSIITMKDKEFKPKTYLLQTLEYVPIEL